MSTTKLIAPFPYFGGKSQIAESIWPYFGHIHTYIEPFFGSGAVLLNRPNYNHVKNYEIINDKDCYIANIWRALQSAPDEVAKLCDRPLDHSEIYARRLYMINNIDGHRDKIFNDVDYYDAKLAAYWIYCTSGWIGGNMLDTKEDGDLCKNQIPNVVKPKGIEKTSIWLAVGEAKRPNVSTQSGIEKTSIRLAGGEATRPNVGDPSGIEKLSIRNDNNAVNRTVTDPYNDGLYKWFRELSERLRYVKVVCGDWKQVCGGNWQDKRGVVGIYFDPPYGVKANRQDKLYNEDSLEVADEVAKWALERGSDRNYRIVISGYYDEHKWLLEHGWRCERWTTQGGYANQSNGNQGRINKTQEALFISPHCLQMQPELF